MDSAGANKILQHFLLVLFLFGVTVAVSSSTDDNVDPAPALWPENFHALLYMKLGSGNLQITNLWYDWPRRRNLNLMQKQLGPLLYDVEWDNGTSFYYTLGEGGTCLTRHFPVGIPRQDWLVGSTYLGSEMIDGFMCNVWEKVDFVWYYEDIASKRPVRWVFFDGITTDVMTFEVGAVLDDDSQWQAPAYCFTSGEDNGGNVSQVKRRLEEVSTRDSFHQNFRKLA